MYVGSTIKKFSPVTYQIRKGDLILLFLSNRQVIYTSFIMKNLSYYSDTKLFDGESILVKHVIMGLGVRDNRERSPEMKWGRG